MTFETTDDLAFLPLGGTGEIGMNLNVYRLDGSWSLTPPGCPSGGTSWRGW
jgi:ribonuclease J